MRQTKIICTIGPSCSERNMIAELIENGMDIARLNRSHGTVDSCKEIIGAIRSINGKNKSSAILMDTRGAEIRTGVTAHPAAIIKGEEIVFSSKFPLEGESRKVIEVNYDRFYSDVTETDRIIIDNGSLIFDIVEIRIDGSVIARAQSGGSIGSRRHITLPGADIDLPSITENDWKDIEFAMSENIDFAALSFIRSPEEVESVRKFVDGKKSSLNIISKIETRQAVDSISEIIDASDGIMVARGDLGTDLPFEELPAIQNEIVSLCLDRGKPVIIATHMLESMIEHPMPTRAEVTDVANAVMTGADATMLSGETAAGKFPIEALKAMDRIITKTETHIRKFKRTMPYPVHNEREARAEAAVTLAESANADAILVFTRTGRTAREISKFRPSRPIIALTDSESAKFKLKLCFGTVPLLMRFGAPEDTVTAGIMEAISCGMLEKGMKAVLLSDTETKNAPVQSVQVRTITT